MSKALYPGTFDPVTNGHLDIVGRASQLFDSVDVIVARNVRKSTLFSIEERVEMFKDAVSGWKNVSVLPYEGLIVDCFRERQASVIVRGMRHVTDFEYEIQQALMNKRLSEECETVFLVPSEQNSFLNSGTVKELAVFNGPLEQFVPKLVADRLRNKLR